MAVWLLALLFPLLVGSVIFLSLGVNGLEKRLQGLQDILERRYAEKPLPSRVRERKEGS